MGIDTGVVTVLHASHSSLLHFSLGVNCLLYNSGEYSGVLLRQCQSNKLKVLLISLRRLCGTGMTYVEINLCALISSSKERYKWMRCIWEDGEERQSSQAKQQMRKRYGFIFVRERCLLLLMCIFSLPNILLPIHTSTRMDPPSIQEYVRNSNAFIIKIFMQYLSLQRRVR